MRRMIRVSAVAFLIFSGSATAADVPRLQGVVNDYANCIPDNEEKKIADFLIAQEKTTSNQVVLLTVESLDGETIEQFSIRVAGSWKLGQADKDNGVLIVHSTGDGEMRIEVGHGLEGVLTDALASQIIRKEMTPLFKEGKFGEGHMAAVTAIHKAIKGEYTVEAHKVSGGAVISIIGVILFVIVILYLIPAGDGPLLYVILVALADFSGNGGRRGGGGGSFGGGGASGRY